MNITYNVELSSVITLANLTNISSIGHNNPTVDCNNYGGLYFSSCCDVKIQGIIWERCGSKNGNNFADPVIKFDKTPTIVIQHCSFQSSIGQAIVLTEISGDVIIGYCMFVNNTRYGGHGTLIYYSSENMVSSAKNLIINNSTFQGNKGSSNAYLSASEHTRGYPIFFIENSTFIDNKNVTFYLLNHNVYCRSTLFKGS